MKPDEIRKLIGGYATGTLTDQEREMLFAAALEDQTLFDALADEEALREMLADARTRQALLGALQRRPETFWEKLWAALTPRRLALGGAFAVVVLVIGGIQYARRQPAPEPAVDLALNKAPEPVNETRPAPAAAPAPGASTPAREKASEPAAPKTALEPPPPPADIPRQNADARQIADERRDASAAAGVIAGTESKDLEKKAEQAVAAAAAPREEADRAVASQNAASPLKEKGALAAPDALGRVAGFRQQVDALAPNARVTDVNGTIVSISVGADAGLKVGDTLEVVRGDRVLGTIKLTTAGGTFSVGPFQPSAGQRETPRQGDTVRRPVPPRP